MKDINVVDLFDEEINKKEKKKERKLKKEKIKENRKKEKEEKKLEKIEDEEFKEYLKNIKEDKLVEVPVKNKEDEILEKINNQVEEEKENEIKELLNMDDDIKEEKRYPFLNFLLTICSIALVVISVDYIIYNGLTNYKDLETLINSILLTIGSVLYVLSIIIKDNGVKKLVQILSLLAFIFFMIYHLYII